MSNMPHFDARSRDEAPRWVGGSFVLNDISDPDPDLFKGSIIASVTRLSNDGEFEVTLDDYYPDVVAVAYGKLSDDNPSGDPWCVEPLSDATVTIPADKKFSFVYTEAGVGIDRVAGDNVRLSFMLYLKNRGG